MSGSWCESPQTKNLLRDLSIGEGCRGCGVSSATELEPHFDLVLRALTGAANRGPVRLGGRELLLASDRSIRKRTLTGMKLIFVRSAQFAQSPNVWLRNEIGRIRASGKGIVDPL